VIKSHHNVGIAAMLIYFNFRLLEPLSTLFKDEVRQVGEQLGLPRSIVQRHPFPGPGLAVRILGEVHKAYIDIVRNADAIFTEVLYKHNYYDRVAQAFVVFMPVRAVGVMGDARSYEYVVCLRAVETTDFMTAKWASLPRELVEEASTRIVNEVPGISRVCYDVTNKPPGTIEWE